MPNTGILMNHSINNNRKGNGWNFDIVDCSDTDIMKFHSANVNAHCMCV